MNDSGDSSGIWAVGITEASLQMYFTLVVSTLVNEEVIVDAPLMVLRAEAEVLQDGWYWGQKQITNHRDYRE